MDKRPAWKKQFKTDRREAGGLSVVNSGSQSCPPGHSWGFGIRDHYLIHLVTSGKGVYETSGQTYSLEAGHTFLIRPGTLVRYQADADDPWEYYWVGFTGSDAHALLDLCGFKNRPVLSLPPHTNRLRLAISAIHRMRGTDVARDVRMTGALYLFLSSLISLGNEAHRQRAQESPLKRAQQYINGNFFDPINVQEIALHAGVSRSQLYRLFMRETGVSPIAYLLRKRISEACSLFEAHNLSVAEAANSVGFSDPLYFSRVFKQQKGVSPSVFRKSRRAE